MTRKSVDKWIRKALAMGSDAALKDAYHRPKEPIITEEAKAWVIHLACSKPKDLGYAAEVWTRNSPGMYESTPARRDIHRWPRPRKRPYTEFCRTNAVSGEGEILPGTARS